MNINIVSHIHQKNYMTRKEAAIELGVSPGTIDARLREIEALKGSRYPETAVIKSGGVKIVNYLVLIDYLMYADRLKEKNLAKRVPAYDPVKIAEGLGWYTEKIG